MGPEDSHPTLQSDHKYWECKMALRRSGCLPLRNRALLWLRAGGHLFSRLEKTALSCRSLPCCHLSAHLPFPSGPGLARGGAKDSGLTGSVGQTSRLTEVPAILQNPSYRIWLCPLCPGLALPCSSLSQAHPAPSSDRGCLWRELGA